MARTRAELYDTITKEVRYIKDDVRNRMRKTAENLAKVAAEDLERAYDDIMDDFYSSYSPSKKYKRTGNLKKNAKNIQPVYSDSTNNTYTGSLVVSSFNMNSYKKVGADVVFDLMWIHGLRGLPKIGSRTLNKSWRFGKRFFDYRTNPRRWENPYWSGEDEPYRNIFKTSVVVGTKKTIKATPHKTMEQVVDLWGEGRGIDLCDMYAHKNFS